MSIFSKYSINDLVEEFQKTENAVLLDVRTEEEYDEEHIPDSLNIPLDEIGRITDEVPDRATKLYVYCRSGSRAEQSLDFLKKLGYTNAINIGGIMDYYGETIM